MRPQLRQKGGCPRRRRPTRDDQPRSLRSRRLAALAATAIAAAEKPTTVKAGNLVLTINGGVTPKALPKTTMAPITLNVSGKIATADGSHPPALKRSRRRHRQERHDRRPRRADLQSRASSKRTTTDAGRKDLQAGDRRHRHHRRRGRSSPNRAPIPITAKLLAFNGGTKGGTTTIYIHAYLTNPITAALVTTVKISKEHKGPYGIHSIASVPKIAGGAGSVTAFSLTFPKKLFTYKGKKHGYLLAKCSERQLRRPGRSQLLRRHQARPGEDRPRLHAEGLSGDGRGSRLRPGHTVRASGRHPLSLEGVGRPNAFFPGRVGDGGLPVNSRFREAPTRYPRLVTTWRTLSPQATTAVEDQPGAYPGPYPKAHGVRRSCFLSSGPIPHGHRDHLSPTPAPLGKGHWCRWPGLDSGPGHGGRRDRTALLHPCRRRPREPRSL